MSHLILPGGSSISTATLTVKGRLPEESSDTDLAEEMEPARPVVQVPLKDFSVFEGKKVRLDCVIVAQPEPEVNIFSISFWKHDSYFLFVPNQLKMIN